MHKSKKANATIYGGISITIVSLINNKFTLGLSTEEIALIASVLISYLFGQGISDIGKERGKIDKEVKEKEQKIKELEQIIKSKNDAIEKLTDCQK